MPKSESGRMFANPQVARMHDRAAQSKRNPAIHEAEAGATTAEELPQAHKIEVHHPDGHENPTPGKFHTVSHPHDGSEPMHHDHDDLEAVHEHMQKHFGQELREAHEEQGDDGMDADDDDYSY